MKLLFRAFLNTLFPPLCHVCKAPMPAAGELHLCGGCHRGITPLVSPLCLRCGLPFATADGNDHLCGHCMAASPPFTAARSGVHFSGPVRQLVHRFKYENRVHLSRPLALLTLSNVAEFVAGAAVDLLVPVPLHRRRLRERGFNQAILLGELFAKHWRRPLDRNNLQRIRWTEPQIALSAGERAANVRGAFQVRRPEAVTGKRLLLVDDVYTTGSTVAECTRTLREAGAREVYVITVARAVM